MAKFTQLMDLLNDTVNKFIAICTNTNRDLPFHDYHLFTSPIEREQV